VGCRARVVRDRSAKPLTPVRFRSAPPNLLLIELFAMKPAAAYANANIALVKYWGKNDSDLNIPIVSSLSMTLDNFGTTVLISSANSTHELLIDGQLVFTGPFLRLVSYLEQIRQLFHYKKYLRIETKSTIPLASGLASSSSFYAALALALNEHLCLDLNQHELSKIARIGSGSAARSIFSGFAGLIGGPNIDHENAYAFPLETNKNLDLAMIIAIISKKEKIISSRDAMNITKKTSPYFASFVENHHDDFTKAMSALKYGAFEELGEVMEQSTLKMFATMWTAIPAINYWHQNTLALVNLVMDLRKDLGAIAYFTMDAGANVKILCQTKNLALVINQIKESLLVDDIRFSRPGRGAYLLKDQLL
jgi:diphosphomevalonate decarboxylase